MTVSWMTGFEQAQPPKQGAQVRSKQTILETQNLEIPVCSSGRPYKADLDDGHSVVIIKPRKHFISSLFNLVQCSVGESDDVSFDGLFSKSDSAGAEVMLPKSKPSQIQ